MMSPFTLPLTIHPSHDLKDGEIPIGIIYGRFLHVRRANNKAGKEEMKMISRWIHKNNWYVSMLIANGAKVCSFDYFHVNNSFENYSLRIFVEGIFFPPFQCFFCSIIVASPYMLQHFAVSRNDRELLEDKVLVHFSYIHMIYSLLLLKIYGFFK